MGRIIDHFLFFSTHVSGGIINLDKEEARHAHSVLRLQKGDTIFVTDGKGRIYSCLIDRFERELCTARIVNEKAQELPRPAMHFFIGLTEKEPFEAAITGLVPLGVMHITPLECENCRKKWWVKKWEKHAQRFRNKMIAAAKQSWNAWLPALNKPIEFSTVLSSMQDTVFVADMLGETLEKSMGGLSFQDTVSCFIGPPEGFSSRELDLLKQKNAHLIKLSDKRLRTELAATVFAGNIVQKFINF